jgi:serine/threonine protein kinase
MPICACAAVIISDLCKDLIQKLLVADPVARLTVDGIYRHPWFQVDLPQGATEMNNRFVGQEPIGLGFQPTEEIERSLLEATQDSGD